LLDNAQFGEGYAVHVVTEYKPCDEWCGPHLGTWAMELQQTAEANGANAGFFVWYHENGGMLSLFYP